MLSLLGLIWTGDHIMYKMMQILANVFIWLTPIAYIQFRISFSESIAEDGLAPET